MTGGVPVAVAVDIPRLELDRPFTYLLPEEHAPGLGLLVSVPFHRRTVRGWVLGPTDDVPGRLLPVRRVLSRVPLFDERLLSLARWMSERYVTPLSVALDRLHPPRVASEEQAAGGAEPPDVPEVSSPAILGGYDGGDELLAAAGRGQGAFVLRPLPDDEHATCLEAVATCVRASRDAVVILPEAEPLPEIAARLSEEFGPAALVHVGGDRRERYRRWLELLRGRYRVVVGTRAAVFAPVRSLGLLWVHREAHPGHREERSPSHHVREIALARARLEGAACVLAGLAPSAEAVAAAEDGTASVVRAPRARERRAAPLVEAARPEREGRSPRLARLLREADGAFLLLSQHGYGVVRLCRSCGEPVRCPACAGPVLVEGSRQRCSVCATEVEACPVCGGTSFGIDRGGTERIAEWAGHVHRGMVRRVESPERPAPGTVLVGTAAAVRDFGPLRIPLVAILDADRARRRPGLGAPAQTLAIWMEAAAWAGPREGGGRVLVHTREPSDPAVQALVRWDPWHLHRSERARRTEAGFPPGYPVFRVVGGPDLPSALAEQSPVQLLTSSTDGEAVCLLTLRPDAVPRFRDRVRTWAEKGTVTRVEAEPQI